VRWIAACLVFLVIPLSKPVDTFDLRQRYGDPRTERFRVRPDVTLIVSYGTDHKSCVLEIEPRKEFLQEMVANETLSKDLTDQLLDEIAPPGIRGKEIMPLGSNVVSGSCNGGMTFGEYENLSINVSYGFCDKTIGVHSATATFKRSACEQWHKPQLVKTGQTAKAKESP
jgi:hypothetical protein